MKFVILSVVLLSVCRLINGGSFTKIDGYQYYLSYPLVLNWYRALSFCAYFGMFLEDIPNEEENIRLLQVIDYFERNITINVLMNIWISGSELGSEGHYYWQHTGHPVQYSAFAEGEPNNADNSQDCLALWKRDNYAWVDQNCMVNHFFICRDRMITPNYIQPRDSTTFTERKTKLI